MERAADGNFIVVGESAGDTDFPTRAFALRRRREVITQAGFYGYRLVTE